MTTAPETPASPRAKHDPLAWPSRLATTAVGVLLGAALEGPWSGSLTSAAAAIGAAVWLTDNAVSRRWPRSMRPQWAARTFLVAALALACRAPAFGVLAASGLAGMATGLVCRDRRPRLDAGHALGLTIGVMAGTGARLCVGPRAVLALDLVAFTSAAIGCFVAAFRGGPGRVPVRPTDVAWLYVLGAAIAGALALR